jgi:hypothetical protein
MGAEAVMSAKAVIPAEAGIHSRDDSGSFHDLSVWIPACAGMTKVFA